MMKKKRGVLPLSIAALLFLQNASGPLAIVYANEAGTSETAFREHELIDSDGSLITQKVLGSLPVRVVLKSADGSVLDTKTEIIQENQIRIEISDDNPNDTIWNFEILNPEEMGFENSELDEASSTLQGTICLPADADPYYYEEPKLVFVQKAEADNRPEQPRLSALETSYLVSYISPIGNIAKGDVEFQEGEYSISEVSLNEEGKWSVTLTSLIRPEESQWGNDEVYHPVPGKTHLSAEFVYENGSWIRSSKDPVTYVYLVIPENPDNELLKVKVILEDEQGNKISESEVYPYADGSVISDVIIGNDDRSAYVNAQITDPACFEEVGYSFNQEKSIISADYFMRYPASGEYDIRWIADQPITLVFTKNGKVDENGNPLQPGKADLNPQYILTKYTPTGLAVNTQKAFEPEQFSVGRMVRNSEGKWSVSVTSLITPDEMIKGQKLIYLENESTMSCTYIFEDGEWILPDQDVISYVYMQYYEKPDTADLKISVVTEDQYGNVLSSKETPLLEGTGELSEIFVREEERKQAVLLNITNAEAYGNDDMKFIPEKSVLQSEYQYGYIDHTGSVSGWISQKQAKLVFVREVRQFNDVSQDFWAYTMIANARIKGIMTGMNETEFGPFELMSRGMAATVLYRMAGSPEVSGENPFHDVPEGTYYEDAIAWCYQNGIVNGYGKGVFAPEDPISRQQIAVMVRNYARFAGKDLSGTANLDGFKDQNDISDYARAAMEFCISRGIIHGAENGTRLNPGRNATRAECAKIFLLASEL